MPNSGRRDRYSALVVIATLVAIVLTAWISQPTDNHVGYPGARDPKTEVSNGRPVTKRVYWGLFTADDTLAQWLMAIFGIVATGASIYAVLLLRDTLEASVKAVLAANETNAIMRAEQRPWVTLRRNVDCKFSFIEIDPASPKGELFRFNTILEWDYDLENAGKSPAFGVKTRQKIICTDSIYNARIQLERFVNAIDARWETRAQNVIFPGETGKMRPSTIWTAVDFAGEGRPVFFLLFALAYRSQETDVTGLEARLLAIDFDHTKQGPWPAKLLEFSDARITR